MSGFLRGSCELPGAVRFPESIAHECPCHPGRETWPWPARSLPVLDLSDQAPTHPRSCSAGWNRTCPFRDHLGKIFADLLAHIVEVLFKPGNLVRAAIRKKVVRKRAAGYF